MTETSTVIERCEEGLRQFVLDVAGRDLEYMLRIRAVSVELEREAEDAGKATSYRRQIDLIDKVGDFIYGTEKWAEIIAVHSEI